MRLLQARVVGFQSFEDSGELTFGPGINLLIGQNNAGKSSFLRALQVQMPDDRHKKPEAWLDASRPHSYTEFVFEVSGAELQDSALERGTYVIFPAPLNFGGHPVEYVKDIVKQNSLHVTIKRLAGGGFSATYPSHQQFVYSQGDPQTAGRLTAINGELRIELYNSGEDTVPEAIAYLWQSRMFYFSAERLSFGSTRVAYDRRLDANASNLAAVLSTLQGDQGDLFRRLVDHLREIFPSVGNLSTRIDPTDNSRVEVRVWPTEAQERPELSFPLTKSGTGVAQVIAILTAIMTVSKSTIIIDEINSFLHPSAVKALLRIIQTEYGDHQYIISTHAPEVVSFGNPASIHLVRRFGYDSTVQALVPEDVETLRTVAAHLGASMADVFAAERVIWVEGETEEAVFPYLYREKIGLVPRGTVFTTVAATGDFGAKRRDREMVYEAYTRLSEAVATMPVSVVFGFDTETLSDAEKADMISKSGGRLKFLPRRHLECYFLDPTALADRIRAKDPLSTVDAASVAEKILEISRSQKFSIGSIAPDFNNEEWLARVDAAKLLRKAFSELSDSRIEYDKTSDGIELTRLMVSSGSPALDPLVGYLKSLVDHVTEKSVA